MENIDILKTETKMRLEKIKPFKVVLFGSYAKGNATEESDIDLYVVTNNDFIPKNFTEKNELYLKIAKELRGLRTKIALDFIVHSKKMYEIFKNSNSSFYKYDINNGMEVR